MRLLLTWPELVAATVGRALRRMGASLKKKPGRPCVACTEADRYRKWHLYRNQHEPHERLRLTRQDPHRCLGCHRMAKLAKGIDHATMATAELRERSRSASFA